MPALAVLATHEVRHSAEGSQGEGEGQLGGARVMYAVGVAERDFRRKVRHQVIDAGAESLNHAKAFHVRQRTQDDFDVLGDRRGVEADVGWACRVCVSSVPVGVVQAARQVIDLFRR
jgi:hypothetical protein